MMVGIRVDCNANIATGHIMRCLAIAEEIRRQGVEVSFIVSDSAAATLAESYGYECHCLKNDYSNKDGEVERILALIEEKKLMFLLIDSYEVTETYLNELHKHIRLGYIDDLNAFHYGVDLLINYTRNVTMDEYKHWDDDKVTYLLGSKYVPLRMEFRDKVRDIKEEVTDVLLTTGGSDPLGISNVIAKELVSTSELSNVKVHLVVGRLFDHVKELERLADAHPQIILHQNVTNMAEVMIQCDLAISAGGTTIAELCACGIPTIAFSFTDNQSGIFEYGKDNIVLLVGDICNDTAAGARKVVNEVVRSKSNYRLRRELSMTANNAIDGNGAGRIANAIVGVIERLEER